MPLALDPPSPCPPVSGALERRAIEGVVGRKIVAWAARGRSSWWREYAEVLLVIAAVTVAGWYSPFSYHLFGHVYLFAVIVLCLRVGRGPILFAAVVSGLAWNYVIMPPRLSFSVLDANDEFILGTYFVVALAAGQLVSRIRAQELAKRRGEQRATALFHLTRALASARDFDEAATAALRQADSLFNAHTALLLTEPDGTLTVHRAGSLALTETEREVARWVTTHGREAGISTGEFSAARALHVPMLRAGEVLGVFVVAPREVELSTAEQRELIDAFAVQIALSIERERLRAAGEREKLLAESDRLHRTLLDCVSHELKTPLAVLRSASENLDAKDPERRSALTAEIRAATSRLDRLVANLLNQTRLESGNVKAHLAPCDIRDLVTTARRSLGDVLAGRTIRLEIPPELPLVLADAPLVEQAIANLLLNAALYTPAVGAITVGAETEGKFVGLSIADRGPGLPRDLAEHLFQKFRRGRDARPGGVGLGLSIVRGFVLAQGGEVEAGDNPGGGARFIIRLQAAAWESVPNE